MTPRILPDLREAEGRLHNCTSELIPGSKPYIYWSKAGNLVVNVNVLTLSGLVVHAHCMLSGLDLELRDEVLRKLTIGRVQLMRQRLAETLSKEHRERIQTALFIDNEMYQRLKEVRERNSLHDPNEK